MPRPAVTNGGLDPLGLLPATILHQTKHTGFFGIDLGPISVGGRLVQFPGGSLPALNLVKFG